MIDEHKLSSHAEFKLRQMEATAATGASASRNIAGKWLCVFVEGSDFVYIWQGGYPYRIVSRATALDVLRHT